MDIHRLKLCIALVFFLWNGFAFAQIKPFTTDGCSLFPDGTLEQNALWIKCCIRHDFAYWKGGAKQSRAEADNELQECVAQLGKHELSSLMHFGVRIGGSPFYPTWYRWGYGWPYMRGYKPLTEAEHEQVVEQLKTLRDLIDEFIHESQPAPDLPIAEKIQVLP